MRLGILPAAGKSERWGGYPKELLPVSASQSFMSRAVDSLHACGCDFVLIVTNPAKIHLHAYHLKTRERVLFALQQGNEMWSAMTTAMKTPADEYFFMMPDTYVPPKPFPSQLEADFELGVFVTEEPQRFGVLRGGKVVNKEPSDVPGLAWGALAWKRCIAEFWQTRHYLDYTTAINDAIQVFDYGSWELGFYFDIGSMDHYAEFLLSRGIVDSEPSPNIDGLETIDLTGEQVTG
jgi:hypothetical protein